MCDDETHDKLSPTPHNLICGHTSVKDVVIKSGASQGEYSPPDIHFAVKHSSKQFFLLLDKGPAMKGNDTNLMWKIFRRGWAPFFKDIEDDVRFTVKIFGSDYEVENVTKTEEEENFWENDIFAEEIHNTVPDMDVFSLIRMNMDLVSKNISFGQKRNYFSLDAESQLSPSNCGNSINSNFK